MTNSAAEAAILREALTWIAHEASQYGDGAPDSHYLARTLLEMASPLPDDRTALMRYVRADDPDDTPGRVLYRARANALARAQVSMARRRVKLIELRDD